MTVFLLVFLGLLGGIVGSFANVVIFRLPAGRSIAFPGSHCPSCGHRLTPLELIPVVSWLIQRRRCRACGAPISARYPLVELLTAAGFVGIGLRYPLDQELTAIPLLVVFAMLVMLAFVDIDHKLLPDVLTLPATAIAIAGTLVYASGSDLPGMGAAALGAAVGAGVIALINRIGSLVLRRFADTAERLWPIGFDQVNLAAVGGAVGGWVLGVGLAAASVVANLLARRPLRLPEPVAYGLFLLALVLTPVNPLVDVVAAIGGTVVAAGVAALAGAIAWWVADLVRGEAEPSEEALDVEVDEPIAMGFGDAKLAAVLGAVLGWELLLVGIFFAVVTGAVGGVLGRILGGDRLIPFGPYLILGAILAFLFGDAVLAWYLGLLGIG